METRRTFTRRQMLAASTSGTALVLVGCGSAGGLLPSAGDGTTETVTSLAYSESLLVAGQHGTLYEIDTLGHRVSQILPNGTVAWETEPGFGAPRVRRLASEVGV